MDIDELKDEFGALSAPPGFNATNDIDKDQSASIINRLIRSDKKSKEILKRFCIVYFVIAAFYFGLFILNPDPELKLNDRINGFLLFLGIMLFAIMGKSKFTELLKINYAKPNREFLHDAFLRYKFWTKEMNYGLLIVVMINIGSCRSYVVNYPHFDSMWTNVLAFELFFITAILLAFFIGYQHWKKHKKPLYDEIVILLNEED